MDTRSLEKKYLKRFNMLKSIYKHITTTRNSRPLMESWKWQE